MEELKKMAAECGFAYAEKHGLMEKKPLLGLAVCCVVADGYQCGFEFDETKEELKDKSAEKGLDYVKERDAEIMQKEPLLGIALAIAYRYGLEKGIEAREGFEIEHDEQGNIVGITNK